MKRKLLNRFTIVSLLLLCGTLWYWQHTSHHTSQVTLRGLGGSAVQVTGSGGQVVLTRADNDDKGGQLSWKSDAQSGEGKLLAASFTYTNHPRNGLTLILPTWVLALGFAGLPGIWVYSKVKGKGGKKKPDGH
jgi:hypothetical protein